MNYAKVIGDKLWVHVEGRTFFILTKSENTKSSGHNRLKTAVPQTDDGILRSPMPGKILKINFTQGQNVKTGETVCVLEAMKMEYALKAPFNGQITRISKTIGDMVALDEPIAELKK